MNNKDDKIISCPKGTYAVCFQEFSNTLSIVLLGTLGIENATGVINGINKIISKDRSTDWKYCIYVDKKTVSSTDAEIKFKEFVRFRKWLGGLLENSCMVAMVFDHQVTDASKSQIERVFTDSKVVFKNFESQEDALEWLNSNASGIIKC